MRSSKSVSKLEPNRQRGYVLVEALLVTVGIGFLAVASISLQDTLTRNQSKVSIHSQLGEMRRMVMENLNNPGVWNQIVQNPDNGIKQCLSDSEETCDYRPPKPIGLEVSAASKLYIDPKKPEVGFGMNLEGCETFQKKEASATACPFQAKLSWQPVCTVGGDCKQVEVSVDLVADPRFEKLYSFSSESYSFKVKKNLDLKRTEMVPGSRTLTFKADDASAPKSVKVFLIADNSTSMSDNRATMAKGLSSFVDGMKGYDVHYYVYTTESIMTAAWWHYPYTAPADESVTAAVEWGPGEFTMPDGSKRPGKFDWNVIPGQKFKRWDGKLQLAPDMGKKWGLDLHQEADSTDLSQIKATLIDVMNRVENKAADAEGGLCTMSHILNDTGPNSPIMPGDSAIFLIMSDEDDIGFSGGGGERTICPGNVGVRPNDDSKIYRQYCSVYQNGNACDAVEISVRTRDKYWKTAYFQWKQNDSLWDDWMDMCESYNSNACGVVGTQTACTQKDIPYTPDGWKWNNKCHTEVNRTTESSSFILDKADLDNGTLSKTKDYCNKPFKYKGVDYANAKDFAKRFGGLKDSDLHASGDCWYDGKINEPFHEGQWAVLGSKSETHNEVWTYEDFEKPMKSLYSNIPNRMRELFGNDGYAMYMVVHDAERDAASGCHLVADSGSYGTKYKNTLLASDTPGNLISVCQENYAASIEHMRTQAQQIARDTYVLDDFDPTTERVYSVQVQRGGVPLVVTKSDYGISGKNVQFKGGFIQGNDQITVVIVPK